MSSIIFVRYTGIEVEPLITLKGTDITEVSGMGVLFRIGMVLRSRR
jgi:hypothetical protein